MKTITNNNFIMQHRPTFEQEEADACYKYMLDDTFINLLSDPEVHKPKNKKRSNSDVSRNTKHNKRSTTK